MKMLLRFALPVVLAPTLALAGCRDLTISTEPDVVDESELIFVKVDPEAPPLVAKEVSFWAVQGETRQVQISYETGVYGNGKCLLFRVPADAVMLGVAPGDSVQITIRVLDESEFRFEFLPAGLQFDPEHPAEVEIRYRWADPDIDGDGDVDPRDQLLAETFTLWKNTGGSEWARVAGSHRDRDLIEVRGPVVGFTQYALATD
ncbi:MAG TPA: hypothetical protein VF167_09955 [Longimicrobiaceae bacterium]